MGNIFCMHPRDNGDSPIEPKSFSSFARDGTRPVAHTSSGWFSTRPMTSLKDIIENISQRLSRRP
jgi:hypothetical protein